MVGFVSFLGVLVFGQVLRDSPRRRVTLCQQPQRVTRKDRHVSYAPKKQGFPFIRQHYPAAPELAHVKSTCAQTCWHRKLMIMLPDKWLAEVGLRSKSKTVSLCRPPKYQTSALPFPVFRACSFAMLSLMRAYKTGISLYFCFCLCCWFLFFSFDLPSASTSHRDSAAIMAFFRHFFGLQQKSQKILLWRPRCENRNAK